MDFEVLLFMVHGSPTLEFSPICVLKVGGQLLDACLSAALFYEVKTTDKIQTVCKGA